jgi:hypothetical protein
MLCHLNVERVPTNDMHPAAKSIPRNMHAVYADESLYVPVGSLVFVREGMLLIVPLLLPDADELGQDLLSFLLPEI